MSAWQALEQLVDRLVNDQWAEPVVIYPWLAGNDISEGGLDPSRPVLETKDGIYVRPGAAITGEGGFPTMSTPPIVTSDIWLSITYDEIGLPPIYGENDRVYWPERNEWYSISYIQPSATNRPNIHLIRLEPGGIVYPMTPSDLDASGPWFGSPPLLMMIEYSLAAAALNSSAPMLGAP